MEAENIKNSLLYATCFVFAAIEVLGLLIWIAYLGNHNFDSIPIVLLLILLAISMYYLYALWKPRLSGVKYFLVIKSLGFISSIIFFCVAGFEPFIISFHVLLVEVLLIRAYYKLLLNMPFEY